MTSSPLQILGAVLVLSVTFSLFFGAVYLLHEGMDWVLAMQCEVIK